MHNHNFKIPNSNKIAPYCINCGANVNLAMYAKYKECPNPEGIEHKHKLEQRDEYCSYCKSYCLHHCLKCNRIAGCKFSKHFILSDNKMIQWNDIFQFSREIPCKISDEEYIVKEILK